MKKLKRTGSIVVTAVMLTAVMGLSGVMVSRQLERDLARQLRAASDGRELEPLVEAAIEEAHYQLVMGKQGDPVAYLKDSGSTARIAPELARQGVEPGVELEDVQLKVVDRVVGTGSETNDLFTALRTTWGVVELSAAARWPRLRGPVPTRRLTVRRLFTVVEHTWNTGQSGTYAHVFPGSVARVMEAE